LRFVSLFAGIGGLDLGLERAGHECVLQVELDPFCQKVLAKHWPDVRRIADVRDVAEADCEGADMIVGGFPCQPVSLAGKRLGVMDERWLWPEYERLLGVVRPRYALVENVPGLFHGGFGDVLSGLAALGYDAEWQVIPAAALGAPHHRERVFILAYPSGSRLQGCLLEESLCIQPRTSSAQLGNRDIACGGWWFENRADLCVGDGVPTRMARRIVKPVGNAVVPQVAEWIGRRLAMCE
jgi:DNA (cytosine-5)-methyltransferase 1